MRRFVVLALFLIVPIPARAQPPAPKQTEALKSLDWMIGKWEGESWIELAPGQRHSNRSLETVQSKVGGAVLLIEGFHRGPRAGKDGKEEEVTTHDAMAMLLYDGRAKRYRFVAYTARQGYGDYEATLADNGWEWGMKTPAGRVKFTIVHTDNDEWSERGENSSDGKNWHQFFQMTLHRAK